MIGVAAEPRRVGKLRLLTPRLLRFRARGRYGRPGETLRSHSRGAMKPYRGDTEFAGWSSFLGQASWHRLHIMAIAVLLLLPIGASSARAMKDSASAASTAHV